MSAQLSTVFRKLSIFQINFLISVIAHLGKVGVVEHMSIMQVIPIQIPLVSQQ